MRYYSGPMTEAPSGMSIEDVRLLRARLEDAEPSSEWPLTYMEIDLLLDIAERTARETEKLGGDT